MSLSQSNPSFHKLSVLWKEMGFFSENIQINLEDIKYSLKVKDYKSVIDSLLSWNGVMKTQAGQLFMAIEIFAQIRLRMNV